MGFLADTVRDARARLAVALAIVASIGVGACASTAVGSDAACSADAVSDATCVRDVLVCDGSNDDPTRCGAQCVSCAAPSNAAATCNAGSCAFACNRGYLLRDGVCVAATARPVHPLSNARVSVRNPMLWWSATPIVTNVRITVCRDRACSMPEVSFEASGDHAQVPRELEEGIWFWNVTPLVDGVASVVSATWTFRTPAESQPVEWSRFGSSDFNGDGIDDFTIRLCTAPGVPREERTAFVFGDRAEHFVPRELSPPDAAQYGVGDVNADGFTDYETSDFAIFAGGELPGTMRIAEGGSWLPINGYEYSYGLGDFDRDGFVDGIGFEGSAFSSPLNVAYGDGSGWGPPASLGTISTMDSPTVCDLDADGFDDVLVSADPVWFRGGPHGLTAAQPLPSPNMQRAGAISAVGDITGDGYPDAVRWYSGGDRVTTIVGGPEPTELPERLFNGQTWMFGTIGDIDGDGTIDLLTLRAGTREWFVLSGSRDGYVPGVGRAFVPPSDLVPVFGARTIGDVNADGQLDAALLSFGGGMFVLLTQRDGPPRAIALESPFPRFTACGNF